MQPRCRLAPRNRVDSCGSDVACSVAACPLVRLVLPCAMQKRSRGSSLNSVALCAFSVFSVLTSTRAMFGDIATQSLRERPILTQRAQRATESHREGRGRQVEEKGPVTERVIRCAIEVHRALGPGFLESAYEQCMAHELTLPAQAC